MADESDYRDSETEVLQDKYWTEDDHLQLHLLFILHAILILLIIVPSLCSTLGWRKDKRD